MNVTRGIRNKAKNNESRKRIGECLPMMQAQFVVFLPPFPLQKSRVRDYSRSCGKSDRRRDRVCVSYATIESTGGINNKTMNSDLSARVTLDFNCKPRSLIMQML